MIKVLKVIACVMLILTIFSILGCSENNKTEPSQPKTPSQNNEAAETQRAADTQSKPALEITDDKFESIGSARYVIGTVKNNTSTKFKFVQVEIDLFDQFGTLVETLSVTSKNLEPNGFWRFKAAVTEKTVETYKFRDITRL